LSLNQESIPTITHIPTERQNKEAKTPELKEEIDKSAIVGDFNILFLKIGKGWLRWQPPHHWSIKSR
jgi:hypothetical protein